MSQVFVGGEVKRVSGAELAELDELAAAKKISREKAAEIKFKKPAPKGRATKKKGG